MPDMLQQVSMGEAVLNVTTANECFWRHPGVVYRRIPDAPTTEAGLVVLRCVEDRRPQPPLDAFTRIATRTARERIHLVPGATAADQSGAAHAHGIPRTRVTAERAS